MTANVGKFLCKNPQQRPVQMQKQALPFFYALWGPPKCTLKDSNRLLVQPPKYELGPQGEWVKIIFANIMTYIFSCLEHKY
jgi:hypothetical protein